MTMIMIIIIMKVECFDHLRLKDEENNKQITVEICVNSRRVSSLKKKKKKNCGINYDYSKQNEFKETTIRNNLFMFNDSMTIILLLLTI